MMFASRDLLRLRRSIAEDTIGNASILLSPLPPYQLFGVAKYVYQNR
jgi:hypothetical protein